MDDKFELLYTMLNDLQRAGVLKHVILVGSWCQDFYRHNYEDSFQIPATRTMDADILIPRRLRLAHSVDLPALFDKRGFVTKLYGDSGLTKFIHRVLTFEFLTDAGAKPEEKELRFPSLNIVAQELHFMNIPLSYHTAVRYRDLTINIPEPEAFALHKLIVSQRRGKAEKRDKDLEAAYGMFQFFKGKERHDQRLRQIVGEMPKSWRKKINVALMKIGIAGISLY